MSDIDLAWVVIMGLFVLILQCGFLCLEAGTVRTKNAANVALKNMSDVCVVSTAFWLVGFGLMFGPSAGGILGTGGYMPRFDNSAGHSAAIFLFQMAFASTAATIVSGAVAERERFLGYLIMSVALGGLVYPIAGHWIWNEAGWLRQMGFIDFAGATVVHGVGGWTALVVLIFLGPRLGRYGPKNGSSKKTPYRWRRLAGCCCGSAGGPSTADPRWPLMRRSHRSSPGPCCRLRGPDSPALRLDC